LILEKKERKSGRKEGRKKKDRKKDSLRSHNRDKKFNGAGAFKRCSCEILQLRCVMAKREMKVNIHHHRRSPVSTAG